MGGGRRGLLTEGGYAGMSWVAIGIGVERWVAFRRPRIARRKPGPGDPAPTRAGAAPGPVPKKCTLADVLWSEADDGAAARARMRAGMPPGPGGAVETTFRPPILAAPSLTARYAAATLEGATGPARTAGIMNDGRLPGEDSPSDEHLMLRAGRGDREAFGLLVSRHHARALRVAWWHGRDPELARDAVQESFLRILRAAPRYRASGPFSAFLLVVVRNTVRELSRRERRRREEPLEAVPVDDPALVAPCGPPGDPATPEELDERRRIAGRLREVLHTLPEELRLVFVLSEIEGLSYREIAGICRCPMGTIASRKHAAVTRLRVLLSSLRSAT